MRAKDRHSAFSISSRPRPSVLRFGFACCLFSIFVQPALPATTSYFDRAAFVAACQEVPGVKQTISFDHYRNCPCWLVPGNEHPSEATLAGVTFRGLDLQFHEMAGHVFLWSGDGGLLRLEFTQGARAFGADLSSWISESYTSFTATVTIDTGESFTFTAPADPNPKFFGFVSTDSITNLTFE